jgi:hypothetical protein
MNTASNDRMPLSIARDQASTSGLALDRTLMVISHSCASSSRQGDCVPFYRGANLEVLPN